MCTLSINNQFNGVELLFDGKPSEEIRDTLKSVGFRWHKVKKLWYAKRTDKTMEVANALATDTLQSTASSQGHTSSPVSRFGVKEGDILYDVWGYSMTLVEFYKVTKIISATKIEIVELGHTLVNSEQGGGEYVLPDTNKEIGERITKIICQNSWEKQDGRWHVKINSSVSLRPYASNEPVYQNTWD